jgi:hypothetical protein
MSDENAKFLFVFYFIFIVFAKAYHTEENTRRIVNLEQAIETQLWQKTSHRSHQKTQR